MRSSSRRSRDVAVWLLWHVHVLPGGDDDVKLIGVYPSEQAANDAVLRAMKLEGFRDFPDGFQIERYEVGKDHWTEGFITMNADKPWEGH